MNILAINTAGEYINIALKAQGKTECYYSDKKEMASIVLLPEIDNLCNRCGITLSDVDYYAVVLGPGSFTGIRIGISTVRAFCQSLTKKAIAVNRLALLAYNNKTEQEYNVSVVDGQNGVSYVGVYSGDGKTEYLKPSLCKTDNLKDFFCQIEESFSVVSDSLLNVEGFEIKYAQISGEHLLDYAQHLIAEKKEGEYSLLEPLYIRKAQAERMAGEL